MQKTALLQSQKIKKKPFQFSTRKSKRGLDHSYKATQSTCCVQCPSKLKNGLNFSNGLLFFETVEKKKKETHATATSSRPDKKMVFRVSPGSQSQLSASVTSLSGKKFACRVQKSLIFLAKNIMPPLRFTFLGV